MVPCNDFLQGLQRYRQEKEKGDLPWEFQGRKFDIASEGIGVVSPECIRQLGSNILLFKNLYFFSLDICKLQLATDALENFLSFFAPAVILDVGSANYCTSLQ